MKTQLSLFNLRHIFALTAIIVLSVVVLKYSDTASSHVVKSSPAVKAAAASNQKIKLQDSYQLPTEYETDRLSGAGTPLGLATADFDADGFPDLVSGYASQTGGYLVFQRGNSESFAPTLPENIENTNNSRFGATFLPTTKVIEISDAPDFIVTGDFNRDNDLDILTAKRGGTELSLTIGNGTGNFGETRKIPMSGTITALAAGQIDSPDNLSDVVIGISDDNGAALLVYQGANGFDEKPVRYNLNNPADLLVLGQMDDSPWMDVAILAGGNVSILHGRNQRETGAAETNRFEEIPLPFAVQTLALGQFIWDREGLNELALLREDGKVSFITQGELDTRPFTIAERMERRRRQNLPAEDANKLVRPMKNWQTDESKAWRVTEDFHVMDASAVRANITKIFNAQLSGQAADDLVVLDTETRQIKIFAVETPPKVDGEDISLGGERFEMALPTENAPVAVLSMRTSLFVRQGLVVLREGDNAPQIAPSAPSATFTVTKTADTNDGACNADCSLREAHVAANGAGGADMIVVPTGTYTLSIAGNDDGAAQGDLDVNGDSTISGAGAATTIFQTGTTNANGIDKVVGFNPTCSNVSGTVNNVTVRFGNNPHPDGSPNFEHTGGGLDYCGSGASTIAITNSIFDQNTVNNSYGGGINLDSLAPSTSNQQITNCTISGNDTVNAGTAGGGGINIFGDLSVVTITGTTVSGNRARTTGVDGVGGGIRSRITNGGSVTINTSTVSNNNSSSSGGGVANTVISGTQTFAMNNTSVTGNTSNGNGAGTLAEGGGFFNANGGSGSVTITESTFTGNTAVAVPTGGTHRGGGGLFFSLGSATLSFSRIANNVATTGNGLRKNTDAGTITATNNWWGCSTGPSAAPCDIASLQGAPAVLNTTPFLRLTNTATSTSLVTGQSTTLTASFLTNSAGNAIAVANLDTLIGLPITFNNPLLGTLSGAQVTIQGSGTATATFTATTVGAGGKGDAVVDNGATATSPTITVGAASTTVSITADTPDPSNVGQNVTVSYSVAVTSPGGGTPTGNVQVSDGVNSCIGTVAAGQCTVALNTAGNRTLTATYQGDGNYTASPASLGAGHLVGTVTWTGATNTAFNTNSNWNTGLTPGSADTVVVPSSGVTNEATLSSAATVSNMSVASGRTLTINNSLTVSGTLTNNGTIGGTGTIVNNFSNGASGILAPGLSPGILNITGTFANTGAMNVEIGGTGGAGVNPNGHDQLLVSGAATLGGTLNVTLTNGFNPTPGNTFTILDAASLTGTFGTTNLPNILPNSWNVAYNNANGTVILSIVAPVAAGVPISGRVAAQNGTGISKARVSLTASNGTTRTVSTNAFGYYQFEDVEVGGNYTVQVISKRYTFAPRVIDVFDEISGLDFTPEL